MYIKYDKESLSILVVSETKPIVFNNENAEVLEVNNISDVDELIIQRGKDGKILLSQRTQEEIRAFKKQKLQSKKIEAINFINNRAKQNILNNLKSQDWGNTYEECLSELQNTAISTETKILYFLKPKIPNLTLTQIRENIALYIAGQKTQDQIIQELQTAGLTQAEIDQYFELLTSAVEVAKLINWIEQVWNYVEQVETQIQNTTTIEELEQIMNSIQFPNIE